VKASHTLKFYTSPTGQSGWHVKARNGKIVAQGELYKRRSTMVRTLKNIATAIIAGTMATCLVLLVGCRAPSGNEAVPSSVLKIPTPQGLATITLPKDESVENFVYRRDGSNVLVEVKNLKAANNAEVVHASWAGVIQAMQAQNERQWQFMQALMFTANKAGGYFGLAPTPIPTNSPSP
jgi:uncharacterized protein YegP (UPF0339 family)